MGHSLSVLRRQRWGRAPGWLTRVHWAGGRRPLAQCPAFCRSWEKRWVMDRVVSMNRSTQLARQLSVRWSSFEPGLSTHLSQHTSMKSCTCGRAGGTVAHSPLSTPLPPGGGVPRAPLAPGPPISIPAPFFTYGQYSGLGVGAQNCPNGGEGERGSPEP